MVLFNERSTAQYLELLGRFNFHRNGFLIGVLKRGFRIATTNITRISGKTV